MKLVVLHYHLRPGGVRRVIELATPYLVRQLGPVESVTLATGEKPDLLWEKLFRARLKPVPVEFFVEPSFGYFAAQRIRPPQIRSRIRSALKSLLKNLSPRDSIIWAHNPGIGRNLLLTGELRRVCARAQQPLALHHHDWWFDNRWARWPEMRRAGFSSLNSAARAIFSAAPATRHLTINRADALRLRRHIPRNTRWLPNLIERRDPPAPARVRKAGTWLRNIIKRPAAPVWILPCRGLRRKNIAEALLLVRWLRPEAWLASTGGASSPNEQFYFEKLAATARAHRWPLRLGVLHGDETRKPGVAELLAASEAVLLTSLQEGFGLPYLEAAAAHRPLIARSIPNIAPDLAQLGFKFPQYYREILVDARLFNWDAERSRQTKLFLEWRQSLPRAVRRFVGEPALLAATRPRAVPFSRLALTAQLEVLAQSVEHSWSLCSPLNPFLTPWRRRAQARRLRLTRWPASADDWLSGAAYARRFDKIISGTPGRSPRSGAGPSAQTDFLRAKLQADNLYPLLWSTRT